MSWQQGKEGANTMEGKAPHARYNFKVQTSFPGLRGNGASLFTTKPQTTPHESHGMTSLTTPHLSYALVVPSARPGTRHQHQALWPLMLALKSCRQGQVDTSSRGGHEIAELREGKHTPPH